MATRAQLLEARGNPNVLKFLNLISRAEGTTQHGYNTAFGGGYFGDLSSHPNIQKSFTQTDGKKNSSGASGRYQFLSGTWNGLAKKYGLNDFGAENQDIGALGLIAEKNALDLVKKGDFRGAIDKLGNVWASFPSSPYKQKKRSYEYLLGQDYTADTPTATGVSSALTQGNGNVAQAYADLLSQYNPEPLQAVADPSAVTAVANAKSQVDPLYGYQPTLSGALGFMTSPTPTQENIGLMSPLASVLFKG